MDYVFKYVIEDENGEVKLNGSTYVIPGQIGASGECEPIELELGSALRFFKRLIQKENEKGDDTEGED
jgi:hypothetical protein